MTTLPTCLTPMDRFTGPTSAPGYPPCTPYHMRVTPHHLLRAKAVFIVVTQWLSLVAQCARHRRVGQFPIACHPRHRRFYQHFAAFEPFGEEKPYRTVCNHPAIAMALDLSWAPIDHPELYAKFFGTPFPEEVLEYRSIPDRLRAELSLAVEANCVGLACSELEVLAPG